MSGETVIGARLDKGSSVRLEPLYPSTRLFKPAVLEAERLREEAARALTEARELGERIIAQAKQEGERIALLAREEAVESAKREVRDALEAVRAASQELDRRVGDDVARLVFPLARALIEGEIELRPERFSALVASALKVAKNAGTVRVVVHPSRMAVLGPALAGLGQRAGVSGELQLREDPALSPTAVRVETEDGAYEGGLEVRLRLLEQQVRGAAAGGR